MNSGYLIPPQNLLMPKAVPPPSLPLVTAIATGISAIRYEFQINPIGIPYHARAGVYIFLKAAAGAGNWDAIYIGETENFDLRLRVNLGTHHRWQSIRANGATHVGTLHVLGTLKARESIETDLRQAIDTPCNRQ